MALSIVARRPDPAIMELPWSRPLEEWPDDVVAPLARGISRHTVRIVRLGGRLLAVKETEPAIARREYDLLRALQQAKMPSVVPHAVVTGRTSPGGEPLPAALVTDHLAYSLPYRSLFEHGLAADRLPATVDSLVILLVRLHLAGFYWGDVSLSNVLFRPDAAGFAAYLVDAETGELNSSVSAPLRSHDLQVACENVYGELLDLQAAGSLSEHFPIDDVIDRLRERYDVLWAELTEEQIVSVDELWRVKQRIERLHELGFDVEQIDLVTGEEGQTIRLVPQVVELGYHQRELRSLTGLDVEDAQARRLLLDIQAYTTSRGLGDLPPEVAAQRWQHEIYQPIVAMCPPEALALMPPAQIFHEILEHRWFLCQATGSWVKLLDAARMWCDDVLPLRLAAQG